MMCVERAGAACRSEGSDLGAAGSPGRLSADGRPHRRGVARRRLDLVVPVGEERRSGHEAGPERLLRTVLGTLRLLLLHLLLHLHVVRHLRHLRKVRGEHVVLVTLRARSLAVGEGRAHWHEGAHGHADLHVPAGDDLALRVGRGTGPGPTSEAAGHGRARRLLCGRTAHSVRGAVVRARALLAVIAPLRRLKRLQLLDELHVAPLEAFKLRLEGLVGLAQLAVLEGELLVALLKARHLLAVARLLLVRRVQALAQALLYE
mmetsp:Transcript_7576/g.22151  ORF Transcript_7576/g.22151 Transcript_7576/m.22151 type:complete len:261 (-) Transcript_7576:692-1474(-)